MRHLLSFLVGSAVTTAAVVLAGSYHAGMVILGGILTLTTLLIAGRILGIPRVCRWLLALHNANTLAQPEGNGIARTRPVYSGAPASLRSANAGKPVAVVYAREEPQKQKRDSNRRRKVVRFEKPEMLHTIPQQVVSALTNLGCSVTKAEQIVLGCTKPGDSFDELFKKAVSCVRRTA